MLSVEGQLSDTWREAQRTAEGRDPLRREGVFMFSRSLPVKKKVQINLLTGLNNMRQINTQIDTSTYRQ